jgi:rhodanese-related sulfurtransferase
MPKRASTAEVRRLSEAGAQLVEVLPPSAYEQEHLPGAVNVPMAELDADAVSDLDPTRPTVVYCYDHECDLSARGARRLETLGFSDVYDYVASKVAWMAHGLPVEGSVPWSSRAGALARGVPTCRVTDHVADLDGAFKGDDRQCVVVDDDDVVLGLVRREVRQLPADTPVSDVMQPAPPTVRPSITATELAKSMDKDHRTYVLVSLLDGTLLGIIQREDLYGQH